MIKIDEVVNGYKTPEARWARFGPYYAMFPVDFAFDVIEKYSKKGDFILDPFAGRGTSIYAGGVLNRNSLGIEINPVGWLYGAVKLKPADECDIIDRLLELYSISQDYQFRMKELPTFYHMCYCPLVLSFLLAARDNLRWKSNEIDATLMSIILVYLHGNIGESLSNQLKISKSMGMNYSINWWKKKKLFVPPQMDPYDFLMNKIKWRYAKGIPKVSESQIIFGNSVTELQNIIKKSKESDIKFSLLFTSPPYHSVTDYYNDQWLRLWMLGGSEIPKTNTDKYKGRFGSKENYYLLIDTVFKSCSEIMKEKSVIYVRTDKRKFTFNTTFETLIKHFPNHSYKVINKSYIKRNQTEIHGNSSNEKGEIDILLYRR